MSNEIKTRRLIVTLPNTCGEEADTIAAYIETDLGQEGPWKVPNTTVTHALGETLPDGVTCRPTSGGNILTLIKTRRARPQLLNPTEARQLAGALLALADEIEGV